MQLRLFQFVALLILFVAENNVLAGMVKSTPTNRVEIFSFIDNDGIPSIRISQSGNPGGCPVILRPKFQDDLGTEFIFFENSQFTVKISLYRDPECEKIQSKLGEEGNKPQVTHQVISLWNFLSEEMSNYKWQEFYEDCLGKNGLQINFSSLSKLVKSEADYNATRRRWYDRLIEQIQLIYTNPDALLSHSAIWKFQILNEIPAQGPTRVAIAHLKNGSKIAMVPLVDGDGAEDGQGANSTVKEEIQAQPAPIDRPEVQAKDPVDQPDLISFAPVMMPALAESPQAALAQAEEKRASAKEEKDDGLCAICLDKNADMVYFCGHMNVCHECDPPLKECPICRAKIERRIKVHGRN